MGRVKGPTLVMVGLPLPSILLATDLFLLVQELDLSKMFVNGTITNDKFCLSRVAELQLSWRRRSGSGRNVKVNKVSSR